MQEKFAPNKTSREVYSGHYVKVKPTPLQKPSLVIYSADMADELSLSEEACKSPEFARFFGADVDAVPQFDFWWATPYALCIYGEPVFRQDPFGNGRGYGDGRAISVAEVVVNGRRWEMQLKGGGTTPFCRSADGRAVLRSSIREFLASEAMHHLGVRTTRALSLVVSGSDSVARPWFSKEIRAVPQLNDPRIAHLPPDVREVLIEQVKMQLREPDRMQFEPCAITCRAASSFIRVGHLDLFARRVRGEVPGVYGKERESDAELGLKQLQKMIEFVKFREFPDAKDTLDMLRKSSERIAELTANWIRVGFCQGNFNSDNCLVSGTQMDYGPFGYIEKYNPLWNMWTGGGEHFSFMNQMKAGLKNFETLVKSVMPALESDHDKEVAEQIASNHFAVAADALNEVWRRKLGLKEWTENASMLIAQLLRLMEDSEADYTITWRRLCQAVDQASVDAALELLRKDAFFKPLSAEHSDRWIRWLAFWLEELKSQRQPTADAVKLMRSNNPKYVPREWMLVSAYEKAYNDHDYSLIAELHQLFKQPYDEQPEFEEKYFRKTPSSTYDGAGKPGTAFMT